MAPELLAGLAAAVGASATEWSMVALALEALPVVVFVVSSEGTIRWLGGALASRMGFEKSEIVGTHLGVWGVPYWTAIRDAEASGATWPQSWRWPGKRIPGSEWIALVDQLNLPGGDVGYVVLGVRIDDAIASVPT
jgi:PAS domain-containing protein